MEFLRADISSTDNLRKIAYFSEAHWEYDKNFMDIFDTKFNITDKFIIEHPVYMGIENDEIVCFWGAIPNNNSCELEFFYTSVNKINNGIGKIMWKNFISWCSANGINEISFVTSPQAIGFYEKMGASLDGERLSIIDNRPIPNFIYKLTEESICEKKL